MEREALSGICVVRGACIRAKYIACAYAFMYVCKYSYACVRERLRTEASPIMHYESDRRRRELFVT